MKLWARLSLMCVGVLAGLLMLSGCAHASSVEEARASLQDHTAPVVAPPVIHEDGLLKVAILTNSGTPEVMQDSQGTYWGLDVDVASALAQQLGLAVELVPAESVKAALTQEVDVILGVTSADADTLTVVSAYMEEACGLFGRAQEGTIVNATQLQGSVVGVVSGTEAEGVAAETGLFATITSYPDIDGAFQALAEGSVDYVACPATEGAYLTFEYEGTTFVGALSMPVTLGAGVASSNAQLVEAVQNALDMVSSNGVLSILRSRWMGSLPHLSDATLVEGITLSTSSAGSSAASGEGAAALEGEMSQESGAAVTEEDLGASSQDGSAISEALEGEPNTSRVSGDVGSATGVRAGANAVTSLT